MKSKLAADVPVTMLKTPEGITICTVYPAQEAKKPHECVPGGKDVYEGNPQKLPDIGVTVELPDGMAAAASIGVGRSAVQQRDRRRVARIPIVAR